MKISIAKHPNIDDLLSFTNVFIQYLAFCEILNNSV